MVNEKTSLKSMIEWVRQAILKIPEPYYNIIVYNILTGLRPTEACVSLSLLQNDLDNYYNKEKSLLEHFKYPELFIRRTKKAYISVASDLIIQIAKKSYKKPSYNALKLVLRRRKLDTRMYYCRKIFATYLRNRGVEQEIIDILQGRSPKSIFARHYYKPDFISHSRIRECIDSLYRELLGK